MVKDSHGPEKYFNFHKTEGVSDLNILIDADLHSMVIKFSQKVIESLACIKEF